MPQPPLLIVEDSDEDFEALKRAFGKTLCAIPMHRCIDGDDCLEYLSRTGEYASYRYAPYPALILLDLNLPGTDGREVLEYIKGNETLRAIPVIILTTSSYPKDVMECYDRGANSYIIKSTHFQKFQQTISLVLDYWFSTVILPYSQEQ
jgi:CheY-like chemotaxis protein